MSALFITYIVLTCWANPKLAPAYEIRRLSARERWIPFLKYVLPLFLILLVVMGSMFAGIASPTDAAALGCLASVILSLAYRSLTLKIAIRSLKGMAVLTTMLFFIIAASTTFAQILAFSGATDGALAQLSKFEITKYGLVLCMIGVLLFLGCFMDQVSMMLLTLPFFMPLANALNLDLIWLGVILLISLQIGLLTPPFGLLLFVMKAVAPSHVSLRTVWSAATPFTLIVMAVLLTIVFVPSIATVLSSSMR